MADKELNIVVRVLDQATKEIKKVENDLKGFAERNKATFQKMAVAGGAAFAGIVAGSKKVIGAYQAQERAEARLEKIAKQVTGATDEQIQGYKDLASQLQKVGVVGDEVIIAGQSQLASFTKNHEVVSLLSKDLADLSVAQYGVNVSQEQAIQTANLMGKALTGQLGALTRTGILVNDEFRAAFEAANTEQERAVILSQIIQDNYGGVNEAMRATSEGGMQAMLNSFGDMQETIGKALIPVLNDVVEKISPIIDKVSERVQENPELVKTIIIASGVIAGLTTVIGLLGLALGTISAPVLAVIAVVGLLAAARATDIGGIRDKTKAVFSWIKDFRATRGDEITVFFTVLWAGIKKVFSVAREILSGVVGGALKVIEGIFKFYTSLFTGNRKGMLEGLKMIAEGVFGGIASVFSGIWDVIKSIFQGGADFITNVFSNAINAIMDKVRAAREMISNFSLSGAISSVSNAVSGAFGARANGGPVSSGSTYLVGERGPELFVPSSSGSIVSNDKMGPNISLNFGDFNGASRGDAQYIAKVVEEKMIQTYNNYFALL